jgi:hypothetical protein
MSRQERAVLLGVGLVAVLLLLLVLWPRDKEPTRRAQAEAAPTAAPRVEERPARPMPRSAPGRAPEPAPAPEEAADPDRPPPLTGLILTFPPGTPDEDVREQLAKCDVVEVRRSRHYVKVLPGDGTSFEQVERCFRFGDVVVSEERGGPPPPARP